jgi:hypothetical protein
VTKLLFSAAALLVTLATPAIAADQPAKHSFTRDGQTYVYTVATQGDRLVLRGHSYPFGGEFHLVVYGNRVDGVSGGMPVDLKVPNAQARIMATADASR